MPVRQRIALFSLESARTTRLRRPHPCRSSTGTSASTASRLTFVTTAIRPSASRRGAEKVEVICPTAQAAFVRQINATGSHTTRHINA
jgi:hypothetical protein